MSGTPSLASSIPLLLSGTPSLAIQAPPCVVIHPAPYGVAPSLLQYISTPFLIHPAPLAPPPCPLQLARQKEYAEAHKTKMKADLMETEELERFRETQSSKNFARERQYLAKQTQARPAQHAFRVSVCDARTLNARHQSRVTLSPR